MTFDFDKFQQIAEKVYPGGPYTFAESMAVFRYFFAGYEAFTGEPHPPISAAQIARICGLMPFWDQTPAGVSVFEPEDYPPMIDRYFATPFRNCDYRINHFFSGKIRELRFYEVVYPGVYANGE